MANVYGVQMSDGKTYDVTTDKHHDNHSEKQFKDHLLDIIKGVASGYVNAVIVHYTLKGRK